MRLRDAAAAADAAAVCAVEPLLRQRAADLGMGLPPRPPSASSASRSTCTSARSWAARRRAASPAAAGGIGAAPPRSPSARSPTSCSSGGGLRRRRRAGRRCSTMAPPSTSPSPSGWKAPGQQPQLTRGSVSSVCPLRTSPLQRHAATAYTPRYGGFGVQAVVLQHKLYEVVVVNTFAAAAAALPHDSLRGLISTRGIVTRSASCWRRGPPSPPRSRARGAGLNSLSQGRRSRADGRVAAPSTLSTSPPQRLATMRKFSDTLTPSSTPSSTHPPVASARWCELAGSVDRGAARRPAQALGWLHA